MGDRVLADVIKDLEVRSLWVTWVGPESNDRCPPRVGGGEGMERAGPRADGSRDEREEATAQELWGHQKLEETEEGPSHGASGGSVDFLTP